MKHSNTFEITEYINALAKAYKPILSARRTTILKACHGDFEETFQYGMIGYAMPLKT